MSAGGWSFLPKTSGQCQDMSSSSDCNDANELAPLEQAAEVRREGFTAQPRALAARQVARCRAACSDAAAHGSHLAGFGVRHSPGHHDVLVPELAGPRFGFLHAGAPWMGTARALLGDGCVLLAAGVLDTEPGAAAGEARHGSTHLLEEPLEGAAASRPHCLAVLIPLVDLGRGDTNGTELWPRSHHSAGWGPPRLDTDTPPGDTPPAGRGAAVAHAVGPPPLATGEALDAAAADDSCGGDEATALAAATHRGKAATHRGQAVSPALRAGDALLFDFLVSKPGSPPCHLVITPLCRRRAALRLPTAAQGAGQQWRGKAAHHLPPAVQPLVEGRAIPRARLEGRTTPAPAPA